MAVVEVVEVVRVTFHSVAWEEAAGVKVRPQVEARVRLEATCSQSKARVSAGEKQGRGRSSQR